MSGTTTFTWTGASGDNWASTTDWSTSGIPAKAAPNVSDTVLFSGTANYIVAAATLQASADSVIFDDPNMTLTTGTGADLDWAGGVFVNAGTIALDAPIISFGGSGTGTGVGEIVIGNGTIIGDVSLSSAAQSVLYTSDSLGNPGAIYFTNSGTGVIDAQAGAGGSVLEVGAVAAAGATYTDEIGNTQTAGSGNFVIESGATLQFDDTVAAGTNVTFNGPTAVLSEAQLTIPLSDPSAPSLPTGINLIGMDVSNTVGSPSDSIEFVGDTVTSASLSGDGTTLNVTDGNGTTTYNLSGGSYAGDYALVTADGSGDSFVYLDSVCFSSGTHIQTVDGSSAVETLKEGDLVAVSHAGEIRFEPIKWIGYRTLDLAKQPRRRQSAPIRIARGAVGDNLPERELTLSPDHCLFLDGKLIPAKLLINNMTIRQDLDVRSVTYYHVELERHSILLAEGVAAESYLDTGNRAFFSNAGLALILHPEFHVNAGLRCWETDACAPLAVSPAAVMPVWRQLADRAVALGYVPPTRATTTETDLHLIADGRRIDTIAVAGKVHSFMIPAGVTSLVLASRATAPSTLAAYHDDPRQLGVAVSRVTLRGQAGRVEFAADHPALAQGWFGPEQADRAMWRWTNGHAALPTDAVSGPVIVEITLAATATYLIDETRAEGRLAA